MEMPDDKLVTLRDLIRWGASRFNEAQLFFGHGTDNALDEALQLVLHAIHLDYSLPESFLDSRVTSSEREEILALFRRRIEERVPISYLTGKARFAGFEFLVTPDVLVPRSPIAELIEQGFSPWVDPDAVGNVLDLCTGSGCIAIGCAHAFPHAHVDAVDISDAALEVATQNAAMHQVEDRMAVIKSDLFDQLQEKKYDLIVSNPPYVSRAEYDGLPAEYHAEPMLGLEAGEDGMDIVARILGDAADYLAPGGIIVVEVGASADALMERFPEVPFLWIDFERGGDGVFLFTVEQLEEFFG